MNPRVFLITGGHHNSALVLASELRSFGHTVHWVGHRYAATGDRHDSAEYREVVQAGIPFHNLVTGKSGQGLSGLFRFVRGLGASSALIRQIHPDAVIAFGGYLGFSVCLPAVWHRCPIFLHEQTSLAGKANRWLAPFARRIYLTWPSSRRFFPVSKSMLVGLPLRPAFRRPRRQVISKATPVILILGGKQGSQTLNQLIFDHLPELLSGYRLIHQTGTSSATRDQDQSLQVHKDLSAQLAARYHPVGYLGERELIESLDRANLVISRAGAHITYELGILGKKCLLIPFVGSNGVEQAHNAALLERAGVALTLSQSELTFTALTRKLDQLSQLPAPQPLPLPTDAAAKMAQDILTLLG